MSWIPLVTKFTQRIIVGVKGSGRPSRTVATIVSSRPSPPASRQISGLAARSRRARWAVGRETAGGLLLASPRGKSRDARARLRP